MTDVKVPMNSDNAVLLLEAAQKMEQEPDVVRTTTQGYFLAPEDVAKEAGVTVIEDPKEDDESDSDTKPVAKKTAAKKTTSAKRADKE